MICEDCYFIISKNIKEVGCNYINDKLFKNVPFGRGRKRPEILKNAEMVDI